MSDYFHTCDTNNINGFLDESLREYYVGNSLYAGDLNLLL